MITPSYTETGLMLSILAFDPATRALGIALASSAIAIGSRCPHLALGKAVVASQGFTNLKVGPLALDLIECGLTAQEVMGALRQHDRWMDYRQIAIVTARGEVEAHTGERNTVWAGQVTGDHVACLGNGLAGRMPLEAMYLQFEATPELPLAERLLQALEQARAMLAPGAPLTSSALLVRAPAQSAQTDLRVDMARKLPETGGCSIADLRLLYDQYCPLTALYEARSTTPPSRVTLSGETE